jgi:hypothetical protein
LNTVWSGRSAAPDRPTPSSYPADRRPERAELDDLPRREPLEPPRAVVEDRLDARVVELVEVDVIGAQTAERIVELLADRLGSPVVKAARLPRNRRSASMS